MEGEISDKEGATGNISHKPESHRRILENKKHIPKSGNARGLVRKGEI